MEATNFIAEKPQRETYLEDFQNIFKAETIFKSSKILSFYQISVTNNFRVGCRKKRIKIPFNQEHQVIVVFSYHLIAILIYCGRKQTL